MRELKFRAWNNDDDEMYQVLSVDFEAGTCEVDGDGLELSWRDESRIETQQECVLMQFTDLTDKNGRAVYEGDVVRFADTYGQGGPHVASVEYKDGAFRDSSFRYVLGERKSFEIEVIGSIYSNPELLGANLEQV
jgi:uncharacterized phage protein (TIGR01671 family)